MRTNPAARLLATLSAVLVLAACGGGGGESGEIRPPLSDAEVLLAKRLATGQLPNGGYPLEGQFPFRANAPVHLVGTADAGLGLLRAYEASPRQLGPDVAAVLPGIRDYLLDVVSEHAAGRGLVEAHELEIYIYRVFRVSGG